MEKESQIQTGVVTAVHSHEVEKTKSRKEIMYTEVEVESIEMG